MSIKATWQVKDGLFVKMWVDQHELEHEARVQVERIAKLPFAFHHIAIMPDCHSGYGMPIGGVLATQDIIVPNAVGVDIGCGVALVNTGVLAETAKESLTKPILHQFIGMVKATIPTGFRSHEKPLRYLGQDWCGLGSITTPIAWTLIDKINSQLGTLGGGNHFIELQEGDDGFLYVMVHSGSRNTGKQVCDSYNRSAVRNCESYSSVVPKQWQLAFLPTKSLEGSLYVSEMRFCLEYAKENRKMMVKKVLEILGDFLLHGSAAKDLKPGEILDVHHNYAALENHFGRNVWVHRKGATRAREGDYCIIPGSQGTSSYLATGLGNPDSFYSCSHGAGRKMSRTAARANLDLETEQALLDEVGVVHSIHTPNDLDEAAGAYKDIVEVMAAQDDLVDWHTELVPLAVVKG